MTATTIDAARMVAALTPRQREAVALASRGLGGAQGAAAMGIAHQTFREYLWRAFRRLGVATRFEAGALYRAATAPPAPAPARACVAATCDDCGRLLPRGDLIRYRHDGTWHCEDGQACAAAMRAAGREVAS